MKIRRLAPFLLCAALLLSALPALPEEAKEINEPDMAAYAACVNGLAVEYGIPVILWDCSVHVNRGELRVNYPMYVEAIMGCYPVRTVPGNGGDNAVFEEESAFEAAANFGPGFNLGNTLDATSFNINNVAANEQGWIVKWGEKDGDGHVLPRAFETAWGQPLTTPEIADYIIGLGFNTVRIPVTWAEHIDDKGNIDPVWMARVHEIVDYFYDRGVYVIINLHHDGGADGWIEATEASYDAYSARFSRVWTQIAESFEGYDERLIFESMNEVLDGNNSWSEPTADASRWINAWNQLFVDSVRATGGNNATRNLIVMTYGGGGAEGNFTRFVLPTDTCEGHLMITVHNYDPTAFTWTTATWTRMTARWSDAAHGSVLRREFALYKRWSDRFGVPIVVGEYNADPKAYADYD